MKLSSSWIVVALIASLIFLPAVVLAVDFEVVLVNHFVSGNASPDGSVVVGGSASASGYAYRWVSGSATTIVSASESASARGASQSGSVVVGSVDGTAFRWEANVDQPIPFLPGGSRNFATDITADASVIVGASTSTAAGGNLEAFRFEGGALLGLGDLAGGGSTSLAWAVDSTGSVIVGEGSGASGTEAARWDNGVVSGLGDLPGGAFLSRAADVSNGGAVVVGLGTTAAGVQAFRWENTVMQPLGDLGAGTSSALSVSGDGSLVVGLSGGQAFIWDAFHGMRDIQLLLSTAGVDLQGIQLLQAQSISRNGETVVGIGSDPNTGKTAVWIATGLTPVFLALPVPVTSLVAKITVVMAMVVVGAMGLSLRSAY